MKIKVLVDNYTFIDQYYYGEPAVCYYIEDMDIRLLFDVGYSDVFLKNATAMNLNLDDLTTIVISHGHDDHTRGLKYLVKQSIKTMRSFQNPISLIAHPYAFNKKILNGMNIGSPFNQESLKDKFLLEVSKEPIQLSENLIFLGEIPSYFSFEERKPIGEIELEDQLVDDYLLDDSALLYKTPQGIYIITGCAHSGICNTIEHARIIAKDNRVLGVLGGFHLFEVNEQLENTIEYFINNNITNLYPCHCVSFNVKARIHKSIPINEVGVGLEIEW